MDAVAAAVDDGCRTRPVTADLDRRTLAAGIFDIELLVEHASFRKKHAVAGFQLQGFHFGQSRKSRILARSAVAVGATR